MKNKEILNIIKKIESQDPLLATYLRRNVVFYGENCIYVGKEVDSILNRIRIVD